MGKRKLLKLAQKLKYCNERRPTKLNCSHLTQNYMRTTKYCLFHAMLEELQGIIKRSTFYVERVLILTHSLLKFYFAMPTF